MYTQVESKVVVGFDSPVVSQAVSMAGGNAVAVEATAYQFDLTDNVPDEVPLEIKVEGSNDLQNWQNLSSTMAEIATLTAVGDATSAVEGIAFAYVRLRLIPDATATSGTVIVAAGINVANL